MGNNCQHICFANASHKWLSAYLGGVMFPKWNPQSEFISDEENSKFQGIFMPMERAVYTYSNLVKILILTKGVGFFDTLSRHNVSDFFRSGTTIRRQKNMEWIEVFVATSQMGLEPVEGVLYQCGLNGLMIHDEADFAEFLENPNREWDYVADELVEEKQEQTTGITFFLRDNLYGREQLSQIKSALQSVKETEKELDLGSLEVTMKNVAEEDWANNWKKYFKPFPVGDKIMIKPSWEELPAQTDKIILKIDPGHIFGTGTHETTQLCMELIEKYVKKDDMVLDIGCGSGILSIASLLLDAKEADAVDIDPNAIQIAYENSDRNDIDRSRYHVKAGNILEDKELQASYSGKKYDLVAANIVADVIIALTKQVPDYIKDGGVFLCSGIITERKEDVLEALKAAGFAVLDIKEKTSWVAIATRYEG